MYYSLIPFIITSLIIIPLIGVAVFLIIKKTKRDKEEGRMQDMINNALAYGKVDETAKKSPLERFNNRFEELLKGAGVVNPTMSQSDISTRLALISLVIYALSFIFSGFHFLIGFLPVIIFFVGTYVYCTSKIASIEHMMEEQIPSFLSTLKSNVQANQTPERALVAAIDNTADPLYSELKIVKSLIETGTFETAMATLRVKTTSKTLKFLCSCIELSTEVGANLETQIVVIENMIASRRALERKMDSAVAENKPLLYVSMILIPGLFIYMYFMNEQTRSFWFKVPLSWPLLVFVILLCLFGAWAGNKIINNVRKM